jgi:two-component system cell cycle response regulator DivK
MAYSAIPNINCCLLKKIVIVEDDYDTLQLLILILEEEGFDVSSFDSVISIEEILETNPNLILLDLWLKNMSGEAIASVLKTDERSREIPIIFISAINDLATIAGRCHVAAFIKKPFDYDHLVSTVREFI